MLCYSAGCSIGVWVVPFYRARFPAEIGTEFALIKASVNGVAGSISATGGGFLADKLSVRYRRASYWVPAACKCSLRRPVLQVLDRRASYWVPAAGSLLAIPFWLGALDAPTLELSLGSLFIEYVDWKPLARSDCL